MAERAENRAKDVRVWGEVGLAPGARRPVYQRMDKSPLLLPSNRWAIVSALSQVAHLERFAALHAGNQSQQARVRDLEAQLGGTAADSFRPPSSDPFYIPRRPKSSGYSCSGSGAEANAYQQMTGGTTCTRSSDNRDRDDAGTARWRPSWSALPS